MTGKAGGGCGRRIICMQLVSKYTGSSRIGGQRSGAVHLRLCARLAVNVGGKRDETTGAQALTSLAIVHNTSERTADGFREDVVDALWPFGRWLAGGSP